MNWIKHFAIGFILNLAILYFIELNIYEIIILSFFAAGSALIPDLDYTNSKARGILDKIIIFIAAAFTYLFYCIDYFCIYTEIFALRIFAFVGVYFIIFTYFKPEHRGITHSVLFAVSFSFLIYLVIGYKFALAGAIGYFSHLIADKKIKLI